MARGPRIIHFMFRITIAKEKRGKRKDEGGRRKKKAEEREGKFGQGRKMLERKEKEGKGIKSIGFSTFCKNNIAKALSF